MIGLLPGKTKKSCDMEMGFFYDLLSSLFSITFFFSDVNYSGICDGSLAVAYVLEVRPFDYTACNNPHSRGASGSVASGLSLAGCLPPPSERLAAE